MFSKDLEQLMLDAQKEAYGDGLDPDAMHPYMWACKPHYYSRQATTSHTHSGGCSLGLYAIYQEQPEGFVEKYQSYCVQQRLLLRKILRRCWALDVTDSAFWKKALAQVADNIGSSSLL